MNFRLVATEQRTTQSGQNYDHTIWMGEFDGLEFDEREAIEFARNKLGPHCSIRTEQIPLILH